MGESSLLAALSPLLELGGADLAIQHRHPEADDRTFLREARMLAELCRAARVPLFVNGRLDVALTVGAHLHLPARGPDVSDVRPLLGRDRWISVAVHDEAEAARASGADFALVSPVFGAGSKPNDTRPSLGVEGFTRLGSMLPCPAFALGGIDSARTARLPSFAAGAATITAVLRSPEPKCAALEILRALPGPL